MLNLTHFRGILLQQVIKFSLLIIKCLLVHFSYSRILSLKIDANLDLQFVPHVDYVLCYELRSMKEAERDTFIPTL